MDAAVFVTLFEPFCEALAFVLDETLVKFFSVFARIWVSFKALLPLFCFAIGPENSLHSINQSDAKLTPIAPWSVIVKNSSPPPTDG